MNYELKVGVSQVKKQTGRVFFIFLTIFICGCAKEMQPIGGEKDITPPVPASAKPYFYSTNFNANKITIKFDEFIQLTNQSQTIISPPLNHPLEITLKGKAVVVSIKDTLPPNTTYNINFGEVIRDYTEGNISKNFQYIFSTGNEIDTIFVFGKIFDASTGKPVPNIQVGLYKSVEDSAVARQKPDNYAVTDKDGFFSIYNIKSTSYKIFALKDLSSDMLFNKPEESTAFLEESLNPEVSYINIFDTLKVIKSINTQNNDTIFADSLVEKTVLISNLGQVNMYMFTQDYKKQFVKSHSRPSRHLLNIVFNREPYSKNNIYLEDNTPLIQMPLLRQDSILLLLPDTVISKNDSIKLFCEYTYIDSLKNMQTKTDTLLFVSEKQKTAQDTLLKIETNILGGKIEMDEPLKIIFNHPIIDLDSLPVKLYQIEDTVKKELPLEITWDTTKTILTITHNYDSYYNYEFCADSLAFKDIYGYCSDSTAYKFRPLDETDYGILSVVMIGNYDESSVFELIDQKGNVVWQQLYPTEKTFNIAKLKAGTYTLHFFIDKNRNGKRDTGSYFEHILPEHVVTYKKEITIKANWDTETEWSIENGRN